ncbi:hypothetical protein EV421DRAFT_1912456 [Armillaria borealis]|uniref:Heterokaryon incompatibility domain-containing protein n=1 Tax=Armillaria borealis TaxID=47425 RepID=A0AA39IUR8_9AGAR|nr:hypothetical protein EV421DRAFT_1912456 [Armillaria borealis]
MKDSYPDMISKSEQNMNALVPSESQKELLHTNGNSTAMNGGTISETISASPSDLRPEPPLKLLVAGSEGGSVDEQSSNDLDDTASISDRMSRYQAKAESSIEVPLQRSYTGRRPIIPSSLADTPCATLGIQGVLDALNATLGTSYTLDTPSLPSILEECIKKNYDFGTAYGRLRGIWYTDDWSNVRDKLRRREEADREMRRRALVGNRIVKPQLPPRRVWDLYSNRVVPLWIIQEDAIPLWPRPISHAWVDEKDRIDVWTPINEKEWPVPIPKDASLDLMRIEMLNLELEYVWLDVICLRQKGGLNEDLRVEEWKLDVPTIGQVYASSVLVVIYLSGLGRPLHVKEGDLDSDRCWFRRAWTLQEASRLRIIAGITSKGPMHANPIDEDENYETELLTRFHKQLESEQDIWDIFGRLSDMRKRVSTNAMDKVAGLAFPLMPKTIPAYHESESLEDAWTALVNAMHARMRASFLLFYPGVGLGCKKWRPTWEQVMTEPLPEGCTPQAPAIPGYVQHDDETDEDWFQGPCIENGCVCGLANLDVKLAEGGDRYGMVAVRSPDGRMLTFEIHVTHQILIPDDMYTLLGSKIWADGDGILRQYWAVGRRLPCQRFEKVSVVMMNDVEDVDWLKDLHITVVSHNVLV